MKYLLPCAKCGRNLPVEAGWAGQTVACECGQRLEVPSVRHLRHLETVENEELPPIWTRRHGLVFVGSAITLAALVFGGYVAMSMPRIVNEEAVRAEVARLTPAEAFVRLSLIDPALPEPLVQQMLAQPPMSLTVSKDILMQYAASAQFLARDEAFAMHQRAQINRSLREWLPLAGGAAVVGILIALSALLVRPTRPRTRKPAAKGTVGQKMTAGNTPP